MAEIDINTVLNDAQRDVIRECKRRNMRSGGLSLPLGFGKTRTSICLGLHLSKKPMLVIVSKTLLAGWIDEISKTFGPGFPYEIMHRSYLKDNYETWTPKDETRLVLTTAEVLIDAFTTHQIEDVMVRPTRPNAFGPIILEYVLSTVPYLPADAFKGTGYIYTVKWGTVIIDEIQRYTEVTTEKCRAVAAICADYRWGLSGTMFDEPKLSRFLGFMIMLHIEKTPRTIPDMRIYLRVFSGLNAFVIKRDSNPVFVPPEYYEEIVSHNLDHYEGVVFKSLKTVLLELSRRANEARFMHDVVGQRLYSAYCLAMITFLRQALICPMIPVASMFCDMGDFQARSELSEMAIAQFNKAGIDGYLEDERNTLSSRFRAVLEKVHKHSTERCIVFSSFRSVTDMLMYHIKETGRDAITISAGFTIEQRRRVIVDFENSANSVMVIPYDIGAEGLNLQCASVVMLVDLWWNSAKSEQAIGRVFRPGQKAPKVCVYIFVSNTYVEKEIIKKNHVKANILSQLKTGSSSLSIPKINMQSLCKLISLEETKAAMSDYRQ